MCSILWWIVYTWEALGCMFSNLSLDSCIGNKGEKERWRKVALHPRTYPKSQGGACAFLLHFWLLGGVVCCVKSVWLILTTGRTGLGNRSDRFCSQCWHLFRGSMHMCVGALVCFGGLCSLLELAFDSVVSSRCPCLRGPSLSSFKWSCSLPLFGFRSLVWVTLVVSFLFPFLFGYQLCVFSMHSSRGRLRTMCGSRTGGWLLPGVDGVQSY
jgi:hypothetical protein